jgi:hypothetical protein
MSRFVKQPDGHFLDTKTGLVWREYQTIEAYTWGKAMELETSVWRLPTIEELKSIISKKRHNFLHTKLPNTVKEHVWSSTTHSSDAFVAWTINFRQGYPILNYKDRVAAVRLVKMP